jgi:hypothetical protein
LSSIHRSYLLSKKWWTIYELLNSIRPGACGRR